MASSGWWGGGVPTQVWTGGGTYSSLDGGGGVPTLRSGQGGVWPGPAGGRGRGVPWPGWGEGGGGTLAGEGGTLAGGGGRGVPWRGEGEGGTLVGTPPPPRVWTDRQTENITSSRTTYAVGNKQSPTCEVVHETKESSHI